MSLQEVTSRSSGTVRRLAAVAAGAAVVSVLGTTYVVTAAGTSPTTDGDTAADPGPTDPTSQSAGPAWQDDLPARYVEGELHVRNDVVVHEHIENPFDHEPPLMSDALDLTFEGHRQWVIVEQARHGFAYSGSGPSNGWTSFAAYVADQGDGATGGDDGWPETMRLSDQGMVVPAPGTTVHNRTDEPRLGETFAPAGATAGAAVVTVEGDEKSYFVVWRVVAGQLDVITTPPNDVVGATFPELLSYARARYDSGEGLR